MPTKTFSGRADAEKLKLANAATKRDAQMTFGQFCSTALVDYICEHNALPDLQPTRKNPSAFAVLRNLAGKHGSSALSGRGDPAIGSMSDEQIEELIASRYA
ncbi:hypothetical protein [Curtanaerobium respiraculi]|uniref:hypothetical protein n=1 Tax=Curtanaerobium respiraculi TaxID=2949669 RepID=UPI0024B39242|nr:hypothetical protein [Curtanaerobium respiraculi]